MNNLQTWLQNNVYIPANDIAHQRLRQSSMQYINALTKWQRFILFHHTLRSARINKLLNTGIPDGYERGIDWAREFLSNIEENRLQNDPNAYPFYHMGPFLPAHIVREQNPANVELQYDMVRYMMYLYITHLQTILLNAPVLEQDVYLYKVTTGVYPGLPTTVQTIPIPVKQKPFNATTMSRVFNFGKFYDKLTACCYYVIRVSRGNRILYLSEHIHGFPYQDEVLLPFGTTFNVRYIQNTTQPYEVPKRIDIQKRPYVIGPITIIDPERLDETIRRNVDVMTYLVDYIRPTGTDTINTKYLGMINQINPRLVPNTFKYNHDNISFLPGKFQDQIPLTTTYIQYIPAFLSNATSEDLVVFEFKNVLGIPITEVWTTGVLPYDNRIPITTMVPGTGIQGLSPLSNQLRMITLIDMGEKEIPYVADLIKQNNLNITTIGTKLPDRTLTFNEAMGIVHQTYGGKRIFYIGSDPARLNQLNIPGVDTYKYHVNILDTAINVVPEPTRNHNTAIYLSR